MDSNWAADHLQVIRTLMERSALYRRALAPIMIFAGAVGSVAALAGWNFGLVRPTVFIAYWFTVGIVVLGGCLLMVRRQALQQSEPFWSPPTRRVAQAITPPLTAGFLVGLLAALGAERIPDLLVLVPLAWVILYGCAVHASGFFMPRGMKWLGWIFLLGGCVAASGGKRFPEANFGYAVMGLFFGGLHLAYGVYLYFTEQRRDAA